MTLSLRAFGPVLPLLLIACSSKDMIARFTPADADARARNYLALFVRNQTDTAADRLLPAIRGQEADSELVKIAGLLRSQRFDTTRVIGAVTNKINGIRHVDLTYELHSSSGWFVADVVTVDSADTWFIEGLHVSTIPRTIEVQTQFTFAGRSAIYYVCLVLVGAAMLTSLGTAFFLATRRGMPKRWVWTLVALLGGGAFQLNWATGATNVNVINLQVFSGAFVKAGPAAPWIITFAIPIGAFVGIRQYLSWRSSLEQDAALLSASPQAARPT